MNRVKSYLFKYFIGFFIIIVLFLSIYANYSEKEITNLAYVVALAIDKGDQNNLKVTVQFSSNVNKEADKNSSGSSQSSSSEITSVECETLDSGIALLNSYVSRNINFSHCKMIIISEELAKNDISEYLFFLSNNPEVSSHSNFMISKCDAKSILDNSKPLLEGVSARYYEIAPFSYKYTGYTKATTLIEFFSDYLDYYREPSAILGNINNSETHNSSYNYDIPNEDSLYVAGETPITSKNQVEYMGLAVFKDGKFVGELNGLETICHLIVTGKLSNCNIEIKNPKNEKNYIDVSLKSSKPKCKIYIINNYPYIELNIKLSARISNIDRDYKYTNKNDVEELENAISKYIEEEISDYLYKISKQYKSDIDGLGKYLIKDFMTIQEWDDYDWLNKFENSYFKVKVDTSLKTGYKFINI